MVVNWQEKKECGHDAKEGAGQGFCLFFGSFKIRWLKSPENTQMMFHTK